MLLMNTFGDVNSAIHLAVDPERELFFNSWGPSFFNNRMLGPQWALNSPTGQAVSPGTPQDVAVDASHGFEQKLDAFTNGIFRVSVNADVLEVLSDAPGAMRDGSGLTTSLLPTFYCMKGECPCPEGSTYTGPALTPLVSPFNVGITGAESGTTTSLTAWTLDDFCKRKPDRNDPFNQRVCEFFQITQDFSQGQLDLLSVMNYIDAHTQVWDQVVIDCISGTVGLPPR